MTFGGSRGLSVLRILFLHNNFPAQFGFLGQHMARRGHDVWFGTARENSQLPGIKTAFYKPHRAVTEKIHPYAVNFENAVLHGQAVARMALALKDKGLDPDMVVAHSGWGPGLYAKDVWPRSKYVGYFEWYYTAPGPDVTFLNRSDEPESEDSRLRGRSRNAAILMDLANCEVGICPTRFQRDQFPDFFHRKLAVQHDGVDTDTYAPQEGARLVLPDLDLSGESEIITYVARGMEPYRGFPQFMEALAKLQKRRPNAHAVIVGQDRVAYGKQPKDGRSYKTRALETLDLDPARTHFTGLIPRDQYRAVLQASSVHVYLTVPFVLSWSMIEAMSTGCLLLASDTEPVREVVEDGKNGLLVDFWDTDAIADRLEAVLADPAAHAPVRAAARETALARYSARETWPRLERLFEDVLGERLAY